MDQLFNPHAGPERVRRSQIGTQETGREITPTAPGGHAKGDNCAAHSIGQHPRRRLNRGRGGSQPPYQIRSAAIAGHEWTRVFRRGELEKRLIPEPKLEGGISGVRGMPEASPSPHPQEKAA